MLALRTRCFAQRAYSPPRRAEGLRPSYEHYQRMSDKALQFLGKTLHSGIFWFDKWQSSPYYTTAHGILALLALDSELVESAIMWFIQTQRPDGSWGYLSGTTEETAYGLQALTYLCALRAFHPPRSA